MVPLKVLLIDDEPALAEATAGLLRTTGQQVTSATTAVDGHAKACTGDFHLVFCDLMMPGMRGDDLCRSLRQRLPNLALWLVLMSAMDSARTLADAAGCNRFLAKPFAMQHVATLVAECAQDPAIRARLRTRGGSLRLVTPSDD